MLLLKTITGNQMLSVGLRATMRLSGYTVTLTPDNMAQVCIYTPATEALTLRCHIEFLRFWNSFSL